MRGSVAGAALLMVFSILAAGCLGAVDSADDRTRRVRAAHAATDAPGALGIDLFAGTYVNITFDGTGWATATLRPQENLTLNVTVSHETMTFRPGYAPNAKGYYQDARNHTHIYLFPSGELPRSNAGGYAFTWQGTPRQYGSGPFYSDQLPTYTGVPALPGSSLTLLVSTTVPGYSILLSVGVMDSEQRETLALRGRLDNFVVVPPVKETALVDENGARIRRDRAWDAGTVHVEVSSMLIGRAWEAQEGDVAYAGFSTDEFVFAPSRSESAPTPQLNLGTGAATGSARAVSHFTAGPSDFVFYRHLVEDHVGTYQAGIAGIAMVAIPLNA